jgi:hypothetical protein
MRRFMRRAFRGLVRPVFRSRLGLAFLAVLAVVLVLAATADACGRHGGGRRGGCASGSCGGGDAGFYGYGGYAGGCGAGSCAPGNYAGWGYAPTYGYYGQAAGCASGSCCAPGGYGGTIRLKDKAGKEEVWTYVPQVGGYVRIGPDGRWK